MHGRVAVPTLPWGEDGCMRRIIGIALAPSPRSPHGAGERAHAADQRRDVAIPGERRSRGGSVLDGVAVPFGRAEAQAAVDAATAVRHGRRRARATVPATGTARW